MFLFIRETNYQKSRIENETGRILNAFKYSECRILDLGLFF